MNFELTTTLGAMLVGGAPTIPTTNEEAKKGYDALIKLGSGYLYHLQYKRATYASRRTPKNLLQWALHGGPYYRFTLLEDSKGTCRQHVRLEELRKTEPGVYYCAPLFHREDDFWGFVASGSVFAGSALIDLADVQLRSASAPHSISFDNTGLVQVWSEQGEASRADRRPEIRRSRPPRPVNRATFVSLLLDLTESLATEASVAGRVSRPDESSGLRTSIIDMRAPRPVRGDRRQAPTWRSAEEALEAFREVPEERDREEARQLIASLDEGDLVTTAGRVAAIDFGLMTVVEPA